MNRARSNSIGAAVVPQIYREGVDPYTIEPASAMHRDMIEAGRTAELTFLCRFTTGVENKTKWLGTMADGNELVDRFRVTSGALNGFLPCDERALLRRYTLVERGDTNKTRYVTIPHRRYDRRVFSFDLSRRQIALLLALVLLIGALAFFAYNMDLISRMRPVTMFMGADNCTDHTA